MRKLFRMRLKSSSSQDEIRLHMCISIMLTRANRHVNSYIDEWIVLGERAPFIEISLEDCLHSHITI